MFLTTSIPVQRVLFSALAFVLAGALSLPAQQRPKPPGERWVELFNGKDLAGWVPVGNEKWTVEEGAIHGQGVTKEYGYLRTEKEYQSFHLFLRFKTEANGNSGVYFHTKFKPGTVDVSDGRQFEIDRVLGHHSCGVYGDNAGWKAWPAPEFEGLLRPTDWNDMLLKVEDNRYECWLNGIKMLDFTDPKQGAKDGWIALQLHSGGEGNMRFKDIRILDLSRR
ncbi:MAG: DUF1080 domain-containing protein [Bryobacterales bacterium]|nr:DUF1080 domain-containing protein [Bryobacterales bacterium]